MRRVMIASAMLAATSLPASAGSSAYALLRDTVERHSIEDGLSKDVTSRICPRVTTESLQEAAADNVDLTYDEQAYDAGFLKEGDMSWSLTLGDFRGSKNIIVYINRYTGACNAYLYFWTL